MATGSVKKMAPKLYNKLISATTDNTGNVVLGTEYNNRCIINVQVVNTLVCWALGAASGSGANKMLHFWSYNGQNLAETGVTFRLFWLEQNDLTVVEGA